VRTLARLGHDHSIHQIGAEHGSYVWDNALAPALEVESGATVELECADASGGQLNAQSSADDVKGLDLTKVNPVTGPVYVKGAEPGDVLGVDEDCGILFAVGRDDATGAESMYHIAD